MADSGDQRKRRTTTTTTTTDLIGRCLVSFVSSSVIQLALYMVPRSFPNSSLLTLVSLSVVALLAVAGVGRCCKRILRVRASPPAFVFHSVVFVWGVYIGVVRRVISPLMDFMLNTEFLVLMIGLCRILSTDPGYVTNESSHLNNVVKSPVSAFEAHSKELVPSTCDLPYEFAAEERVRCCGHCKAYVKGFDHHCPAFGNCIGQKNHVLFISLLLGFISTEASYIACSSQFTAQIQILDKTGHLISFSRNLAVSTMVFSLLQWLWQVVFLAWHIYCICFNIRTDEWLYLVYYVKTIEFPRVKNKMREIRSICDRRFNAQINWKKYPEFHMIVQPEPGQNPSGSETRFTNPYNKGILSNVKEFLAAKE